MRRTVQVSFPHGWSWSPPASTRRYFAKQERRSPHRHGERWTHQGGNVRLDTSGSRLRCDFAPIRLPHRASNRFFRALVLPDLLAYYGVFRTPWIGVRVGHIPACRMRAMPKHASHKMPRPRVMPPLPVWVDHAQALLSELPASMAAELWLQSRHVRDWLSGGNLAELFHPEPSPGVLERRAVALSEGGVLQQSLMVFHALTDRNEVDSEQIAAACVEVADWANASGYFETAMQFSAAGAAAAPDNPRVLNAAGLMHRRGGRFSYAELYYLRAAYFAQNQTNADERVSSHIGLAALCCSRRQYRRARRHLDRASNIAQRCGSTWLAAHTQHDLMLMLTERRDFVQAEHAAGRAASLYPLNDSRFPFFAADFGFLRVAQGLHSEAVPILEQFLSLIADRPSQQVIGLSLLARAYAGTGKVNEYLTVRDTVEELVSTYPLDAGAAYFHLAEAARWRGDWTEAARSAALSRRAALARGDSAIVQYAERLEAAIAHRQADSHPHQNASSGRRAIGNVLAGRLGRWNPESKRGRPRQPRRNHWSGV